MNDTVAVQVKKLTKRYPKGSVNAVDDLSLVIHTGEVCGFLGSNGAGKSTTIRTMMNFIRPTSGSVEILGNDSVAGAVASHRAIGYVAGDVALPRNVTGRQLLDYLGALQGSMDRSYLHLLTERFSVQLDKKIGELSKGNRQKIGLLQAFMHKPKVLILDEPTSGLDPLMQEAFYATIAEAKGRGAAIFLSSHNFAEVERVCDRVAIIRSGKLVADTSVAELQKTHLPTWRVTLKNGADARRLQASKALSVTIRAKNLAMVRPTQTIAAALAAMSEVEILSLRQEADELEDEFMTFYKGGA
jgi:ABC-2 type transport system ATP-binding protein